MNSLKLRRLKIQRLNIYAERTETRRIRKEEGETDSDITIQMY